MIALDSAIALARSTATSNNLHLTDAAIAAAGARLSTELAPDDESALTYAGGAPIRIANGKAVDVPLGERILEIVQETAALVQAEASVYTQDKAIRRNARIAEKAAAHARIVERLARGGDGSLTTVVAGSSPSSAGT